MEWEFIRLDKIGFEIARIGGEIGDGFPEPQVLIRCDLPCCVNFFDSLIDRVTGMHNKIASTAEYQTLADSQIYKNVEQFDQFQGSDSAVAKRILESRQKWS